VTPPTVAFATLAQDFFQRRLVAERGVSAHTLASYRDTFTLFLRDAEQRTGKAPTALTLEDLSAPIILAFLDRLETERGNSPRTRNLRLTALRSFMRYAAQRSVSRAGQHALCGLCRAGAQHEAPPFDARLHQSGRVRAALPNGRGDPGMRMIEGHRRPARPCRMSQERFSQGRWLLRYAAAPGDRAALQSISRSAAMMIVAPSKTMWTLPPLWTHRTRPQGFGNLANNARFPQRPHRSSLLCKKKKNEKQDHLHQLSTESDHLQAARAAVKEWHKMIPDDRLTPTVTNGWDTGATLTAPRVAPTAGGRNAYAAAARVRTRDARGDIT
jgi:hypothetical protein